MITSPIRPRCLSIVIRAESFCRRWVSTRPGLYTIGYRPSITSILRDPSGYLLAAGFQMQTKDVMYVANAKVVDYYKLLTLINNTSATVANTANTVTSVNVAAKTRW